MNDVDMTGKTVLITGSNSGIGMEAARALAQMGAVVVMHARDRGRGEAARKEIEAATGNPNLHLLLADLASMQQVRGLAASFRERFDRLDVLVNNAGVIVGRRELTDDGLERTFAVNHLSHFLLTHLLIDLLKASAPSRVVTVSSAAHRVGTMDFDNLQGEQRYNEWTAYGYSKLANVMFSYELARRLEGSGVTSNAMHPGMVRTRFGGDGSIMMRLVWLLAGPFKRTPKQGARTIVHLATSPKVEGVTGKYYIRREARDSSDASYERAAWDRLWRLSEQLVGLSPEA